MSCTPTPSAKAQHNPFLLPRCSNHSFSGEPAKRPSSRANISPGASVIRQNVTAVRPTSLYIVASIDRCRVSDSKRCAKVATRRVATASHFWCEQLGYVSHAPLGLSLGGTLWLCWQLQNRSLLALAERCQQHDPPIRKFQCIVMRRDLVSVDLPKDRSV